MSAALDWSAEYSAWTELSKGASEAPGAAERSRFDGVHARIEKMVHRVVSRRMGVHEDREDVLQDTLLQVYLGMSKLRDPESLDLWAARIAINMVNTHLRRRPRGQVSREEYPGLDVPFSEDVEVKLLASRALGLIRKLPPRDRDAFCRSVFTPGTAPQMARAAKCSVATIKRQSRRARRRFERMALADPRLSPLVRSGSD